MFELDPHVFLLFCLSQTAYFGSCDLWKVVVLNPYTGLMVWTKCCLNSVMVDKFSAQNLLFPAAFSLQSVNSVNLCRIICLNSSYFSSIYPVFVTLQFIRARPLNTDTSCRFLVLYERNIDLHQFKSLREEAHCSVSYCCMEMLMWVIFSCRCVIMLQ